jgi:hypothetical protein
MLLCYLKTPETHFISHDCTEIVPVRQCMCKKPGGASGMRYKKTIKTRNKKSDLWHNIMDRTHITQDKSIKYSVLYDTMVYWLPGLSLQGKLVIVTLGRKEPMLDRKRRM